MFWILNVEPKRPARALGTCGRKSMSNSPSRTTAVWGADSGPPGSATISRTPISRPLEVSSKQSHCRWSTLTKRKLKNIYIPKWYWWNITCCPWNVDLPDRSWKLGLLAKVELQPFDSHHHPVFDELWSGYTEFIQSLYNFYKVHSFRQCGKAVGRQLILHLDSKGWLIVIAYIHFNPSIGIMRKASTENSRPTSSLVDQLFSADAFLITGLNPEGLWTPSRVQVVKNHLSIIWTCKVIEIPVCLFEYRSSGHTRQMGTPDIKLAPLSKIVVSGVESKGFVPCSVVLRFIFCPIESTFVFWSK